MRQSLLTYICCPACRGQLSDLLEPPQEEQENREIEIKENILTCEPCGNWFPVRNFVPELLPNHLRNRARDLEFLETMELKPTEEQLQKLREQARAFTLEEPSGADAGDEGSHHKKSEISIESKITDQHFFGPGFLAPFNPSNPEFTMTVVRRLGNVLPLLELNAGDVVLDMGPGYAWTTEWMLKMGLEPIGVDICRTYLDIGIQRMERGGEKRPHLVIADIENLPLKDEILNAVLCFDAFHHVPDRPKAMAGFFRSLKAYGNIALAEPAGDHEFAKVSREVMDKYGILEKGMDLEDVNGYCRGLQVEPPEQHYVLKFQHTESSGTLTPEFIRDHSYVDCNIYRIKKRLGEREQPLSTPTPAAKFTHKVKQKVKRILKKLLLRFLQ